MILSPVDESAEREREIVTGDIHQRRRLKNILYKVGCEICRKSEIASLSVNDILRRTTVARSTFYKYFNSKESYFEFLVTEAELDVGRNLDLSVAGLSDPAERLCWYVEAYLLYCSTHLNEASVIIKLSEYRISKPSLIAKITHGVIQSGVDTGRFPISDVDVVHIATLGSVNALLVRVLEADATFALEAVTRDLLKNILRMLRVPFSDISDLLLQ